ncbi:MAG: RNA methyltransferase [Bacteroidales bacterium]|nr:RNA methyltransferase [Bacteroidales bacterium]
MLPLLESVHNPKIKGVLALLEKPKERRNSALFAVEGARELSMALAADYAPQALYYLPHIVSNPHQQFALPPEFLCQPVAPNVYKKMAYRESTEGVIAVMHRKERSLSALNLPPRPLVLVIEAIEKPGNIGAMLRTADAAQVDAVLVCDPLCDLYNPNLIRASLGALFTRQVAACCSTEAVAWLQQQGIDIYAATLQNAVSYHSQDYRLGCAIAVGSEAHGLSSIWKEAARACIQIPMRGSLDSLNVSVSAAVLVFEAVRQRTSKV